MRDRTVVEAYADLGRFLILECFFIINADDEELGRTVDRADPSLLVLALNDEVPRNAERIDSAFIASGEERQCENCRKDGSFFHVYPSVSELNADRADDAPHKDQIRGRILPRKVEKISGELCIHAGLEAIAIIEIETEPGKGCDTHRDRFDRNVHVRVQAEDR